MSVLSEQAGPRVDRAPAGAPLLRAEKVVKRFGARTAVDAVSFTVSAGECFGLLGPNGAGKSTTIMTVCGLLRPDRGSVRLGERQLPAGHPAARRTIGYVPQEIAVYDDLTGRENLRFFAGMYGLRRRAARERCEETLDFVGLRDRGDDRAATYSGGMKRRLNIAAALLHRPALLVLDEPTVGVDPQSRNAILDGLERLKAEGVALLYSSHYMAEVQRLADRIAILDEGRVLTSGTPAELLRHDAGGVRVNAVCDGLPDDAAALLAGVPGVSDVRVSGGRISFAASGVTRSLPAVLARLDAMDATVGELSVEQADLESVFLQLTGKALRDE
ncbi:ABC transporter ATP-binding protein [Streptomyces sp. NPDC051940]|uniref:ABC transporter ATP-binding protein n=1 Tax=Streptomyces sp. NPDC051940 TaxID=3155675 RepID=UPI00342D6FDD